MATINAIASGNYSNPATWDGNQVPGASDTANALDQTVTIDGDVTAAMLIATTGTFQIETGHHSITANILGGHLGATLSHLGTGTVTIVGNVIGGTETQAKAIWNGNTGTIDITGNVIGGSGQGSSAIINQNTGTIIVTGTVKGGSGQETCGIENVDEGHIIVTGHVLGGTGAYSYGITNNHGQVSVTGSIIAGITWDARNSHPPGDITADSENTSGPDTHTHRIVATSEAASAPNALLKTDALGNIGLNNLKTTAIQIANQEASETPILTTITRHGKTYLVAVYDTTDLETL